MRALLMKPTIREKANMPAPEVYYIDRDENGAGDPKKKREIAAELRSSAAWEVSAMEL